MFHNSTLPNTENRAPEDGTKMEEVDIPQLPVTRSRRPLGDISNLAPSGRNNNLDAKRPNISTIAPPLPEPSVTDSIQSVGSSLSVTSSIDDTRPYMRRDSDNIDSRDVDNPLLCTEVVNDMYDNFRRIEMEVKVNPNYMNDQTHINEKMRAILIDWLVNEYIFMS